METLPNNRIGPEEARAVSEGEIPALLHDVREPVLLGLLENPSFNERHVCLLLLRKDLSMAFVESLASREHWTRSYEVKRALAFHPHVPQLVGLRLARELYVGDLVHLAMEPSVAPPVKHLAEELVLARLPQLPPAQKMILARRGSVRIAGALLADGQGDVIPIVLESPFLNEGQILRVLSRVNLNARVILAVAESGRWNQHYSVRLALVRNGQTPLGIVLSFLPSISTADLRILAESSSLPTHVRTHVRKELAYRMQHGRMPEKKGPRVRM